MNIQISFRGMDHSDLAENYVHLALEKVAKYLEKEPDPITIEVLLEAHRVHAHHKVEIRIHSKHNHFIIKHEGEDLYYEIDHVIKVLIEEIKKNKNKNIDQRNQKADLLVFDDEYEDID
ncbi:HPF/RaiA family ribosome-associated protein [Candidatus Babeliales bacterium]|nr:HPF/RaiA family ribosome-associated protein [Candidatus Babeliales bacterium]